MRINWDEWRGSLDGRPAMYIKRLLTAFGCAVHLHKFVRGDDAGCFHTHPAYAVRLVLAGGYVEELASGRMVEWKPLRIGIVRPSFEHRIDHLLNGRYSYSLWLRGPKIAAISIKGC